MLHPGDEFLQEEIHQKEMAEQQNRATSVAARLDGLQADLAATQDQVSELHALNEALARDLSAKSQALENSEAALQDSGSRCTAVGPVILLCHWIPHAEA